MTQPLGANDVSDVKRARKLKLWNGRWRRNEHIYVAAHSVDDALALIKELGEHTTRSEISTYWSAGHWGNDMNGITPERGAWVQIDREPPIRMRANERRSK